MVFNLADVAAVVGVLLVVRTVWSLGLGAQTTAKGDARVAPTTHVKRLDGVT